MSDERLEKVFFRPFLAEREECIVIAFGWVV